MDDVGIELGISASVGAILLAVRRPTSGDEAVDEAFRLHSARVALGLGMAVAGLLAASSHVSGVAVFALCLVLVALGWSLVGPPRAEVLARR